MGITGHGRAGGGSGRAQALPSLTGIRGVAAIWVVLFHVAAGVGGYSIVPWLNGSALITNGFRGVDLFFILSGFIMMHVHAEDFVVIRAATIRQFAIARVARIYPVNLFVLLLILAAVSVMPAYVEWTRAWSLAFQTTAYTPISFLQNATLTTRWLVPDLGISNSVTWSLSVELLAYAMLPLLARGLSRTHCRTLCLALALASLTVMVGVLVALGSADAGSTGRLGILRGIGGFAAGAAICRFATLTHIGPRTAQGLAAMSLTLLVLFAEIPSLAILMPFPFLILIAALKYQSGVIHRILSSRFAVFMGSISFSVYLVHVTPLMMLEWAFASGRLAETTLNRSLFLLSYGAGVILLSTALHRWIERPSHRAGRRLFVTLQRRVEAVA